MAQIADHGDKSTAEMAEGGKLHTGEKHSGDNQGANKRRNVTAEEVEAFKQLHEQGFTGTQIAALTGRSKTAVYKHLQLKEKSRPRWTDEEMQILVDGYFEGESVKKIAKKLGRSPTAVRVAMCRYRKAVNSDPKKKRVMGVMTYVLKVMRKADIFRELDSGVSSTSLPMQ